MEYISFEFMQQVAAISELAGKAILEVYNSGESFEVTTKQDDSPVTKADHLAHEIICRELRAFSDYPILSEEGDAVDFEVRRQWRNYWLVDPLDGTREFIDQNGDFTVNIALVTDHVARLGVIFAPDKNLLYVGSPQIGAFKRVMAELWEPIQAQNIVLREAQGLAVRLLGSRRYGLDQLREAMIYIEESFGAKELLSVGSALKFCLVADGQADCYARFGPTCEWDTAAGQAILESAGGRVLDKHGQPFRYNQRESLINGDFWALGDPDERWLQVIEQVYR